MKNDAIFERRVLSKTLSSILYSDVYVISAIAISKNHFNMPDGKEFKVYWGMVRGMSDNGQPGWNGDRLSFLTIDDAEASFKYASNHKTLYGAEIIEGSPKISRVVTKTIKYEDVYDVDEARKLIEKEKASFRDYMGSR